MERARTPFWRRTPVRIAGSLAFLAVLFALLPLDQLWSTLGRVSAPAWGATIAAFLSLHALGAVKWRLVVNRAGAGLSVIQALRFYYFGLFGNMFLPSVVGGDLVRAGLALREARSKAGVLLGSVVDRSIDMLALAGVAGLGVVLLPGSLDGQSRGIVAGFAILVGTIILVCAFALLLVPRNRLSFRMRRRLVRLRQSARAITKQPASMGVALVLGFVLQLGLIGLTMMIGRVCGLDAPLRVWLFVWPLAKISALLPVTQGGIGVREAAHAALFAPFGVPAVLAVAVSLVWQAILLGGGLIGGIIAYTLSRITRGVDLPAAPAVADDDLATHP